MSVEAFERLHGIVFGVEVVDKQQIHEGLNQARSVDRHVSLIGEVHLEWIDATDDLVSQIELCRGQRLALASIREERPVNSQR